MPLFVNRRAMRYNRLYFMDSNDRVADRLDTKCRGDDHAVETATEHHKGAPMGLWLNDRRVMVFGEDWCRKTAGRWPRRPWIIVG
jgi:hypothetical protein